MKSSWVVIPGNIWEASTFMVMVTDYDKDNVIVIKCTILILRHLANTIIIENVLASHYFKFAR